MRKKVLLVDKIFPAYFPEVLVRRIGNLTLPPYGAIIQPGQLNWYDDWWFMRDTWLIYRAFKNGFVTVVTVNPIIEVNWHSRYDPTQLGSYLEMMEPDSFDEMIEGFPHKRLIPDYSELFKSTPE